MACCRRVARGAFYRKVMEQLPEDFDIEVLRPLLPAHVPLPTPKVLDPKYAGLARIADC